MEKMWVVKNAARRIGVAHTTLYRWIDKGTVKTRLSAGGVVLIPDSEVRRLMEEVASIKATNEGELPRGQLVGRKAQGGRRQRTGS